MLDDQKCDVKFIFSFLIYNLSLDMPLTFQCFSAVAASILMSLAMWEMKEGLFSITVVVIGRDRQKRHTNSRQSQENKAFLVYVRLPSKNTDSFILSPQA